MKYLKYLLIILLVPFIVLAEECDVSNITITSMEQNSIEGNTEVISDPTFEDRTINLDLKMYDVGDSISYDMTIKNDSEEDYMIDEDTFKTDSDYIEYTLKTKDNSNVVKANSSKEVSLIVTYKKAVEDDKLTNNSFDASNTLKLSLNTDTKEQPLDIITTDNKKEIKNPVTSISSMMLISIILLTSIVIIYILIKRKNKYTKYLLILLSMILIPTVYAVCKCEIEVKSSIKIEKHPKLYDTVADLSKETNSCITKYEGEVTDEVGKTVTATNVYFDKCVDKRNVIFGDFCWQIVRTTDTKGTKIVYNGEPVDGKCESTRESHKGIFALNTEYMELDNEYLYGSSFSYDINNGTFTLTDTTTAIWSDSNPEELIGKYTCMNSTGVCSVIYNINNYIDTRYAFTTSYSIDNVNKSLIATSPFNADLNNLSSVGYMYNKTYRTESRTVNTTYKYGSDAIYDNNTNTYTLSGNVKEIPSTGNKKDIHYTCWNTTGTCSIISFIHGLDNVSKVSYVNLKNGEKGDNIINDMFNNDNLNVFNSSIKGIIDAWYKQNLIEYQSKIEDTIYCNNREISELIGWRTDINLNTSSRIVFNANTLTCNNITDSFSISNNKAKLTYPISLININEWENINDSELRRVNKNYWTLSPNTIVYYHNDYFIKNRYVFGSGDLDINYEELNSVASKGGVRPAISLSYENKIISGTGSETDPWIIE